MAASHKAQPLVERAAAKSRKPAACAGWRLLNAGPEAWS